VAIVWASKQSGYRISASFPFYQGAPTEEQQCAELHGGTRYQPG
jgi:hypothetical protein